MDGCFAGGNVQLKQQRVPAQSVRAGRGEVQSGAGLPPGGAGEGGGLPPQREAPVAVPTLAGSHRRRQGRAVRLHVLIS